jgi:hypothetical protein
MPAPHAPQHLSNSHRRRATDAPCLRPNLSGIIAFRAKGRMPLPTVSSGERRAVAGAGGWRARSQYELKSQIYA